MNQNEVRKAINEFLIDRLEIDETLIIPNADLKDDLGMSSMDIIDAMGYIKLTFGFRPSRGVIHSIHTVEELYNYVETNCMY